MDRVFILTFTCTVVVVLAGCVTNPYAESSMRSLSDEQVCRALAYDDTSLKAIVEIHQRIKARSTHFNQDMCHVAYSNELKKIADQEKESVTQQKSIDHLSKLPQACCPAYLPLKFH
ncbi:hypothetical protein [Vibrio coralliilyticus]|uniref:hypothetical protein n=1 Tax=Vibrio coralliilyticus TaxID=190893 RepID=UPI0017AF0EFF|nr:hypothetical protein [Vibrio coralliilyticus]NUW69162.1 hypothetical protein [Vibrio coralliilyticus]